VLLHFDGLIWTPASAPTQHDVEALFGIGAGDLWLAGGGGMLVHRRR
jgi:hypothetical protein